MNFEYEGSLDRTSVKSAMGTRIYNNKDRYRLSVPETGNKIILTAKSILPTIDELELHNLKGKIEGPLPDRRVM